MRTTYQVYVIELDGAAGKRVDPRKPWVYVGSTAHAPEVRLQRHLDGVRSRGSCAGMGDDYGPTSTRVAVPGSSTLRRKRTRRVSPKSSKPRAIECPGGTETWGLLVGQIR